jgi:hypothetical protein
VQFNADADRMDAFTAEYDNDGRVPGYPKSNGCTCVFGGAAAVGADENSLVGIAS